MNRKAGNLGHYGLPRVSKAENVNVIIARIAEQTAISAGFSPQRFFFT
jgi:hypothetical protein